MYTGGSLFLIALGAILYWAVETDVDGFDFGVAGVVLMVIGGIGLVYDLLIRGKYNNHRDL